MLLTYRIGIEKNTSISFSFGFNAKGLLSGVIYEDGIDNSNTIAFLLVFGEMFELEGLWLNFFTCVLLQTILTFI